jgi:hypothetical protein
MPHEKNVPAKWIFTALLALFVLTAAWGQPQDPKSLGFKKQFAIEIRNPGPLALDNYPVILNVEEIRAFAPDFNSYNYAIFEETGRDYRLVLSQADDLNKDRTYDEIVFVRTLPPSSTTRLTCYYSPKGSFQLMMSSPRAYARLGGDRAGSALGFESNLAAFMFVDGRIEVYGKLYPGLVLMKLRGDDAILQEWGMNILAGGGSAGLGGLSLWEGKTRIPLAGPAGAGGVQIQRTVLAAGPIRALVKAEYSGIRSGQREYGAVVFLSAFADNVFSREDVILNPKAGGPTVFGVGIQKLANEGVTFDKDKGFLAAWGRGAETVGEVGLAVLFTPSEFAGLDEDGPDRSIKLNARPGRKQTFWTVGGWGRGIVTAASPAAQNWAVMAGELGLKLRVPVEVRYKAY